MPKKTKQSSEHLLLKFGVRKGTKFRGVILFCHNNHPQANKAEQRKPIRAQTTLEQDWRVYASTPAAEEVAKNFESNYSEDSCAWYGHEVTIIVGPRVV